MFNALCALKMQAKVQHESDVVLSSEGTKTTHSRRDHLSTQGRSTADGDVEIEPYLKDLFMQINDAISEDTEDLRNNKSIRTRTRTLTLPPGVGTWELVTTKRQDDDRVDFYVKVLDENGGVINKLMQRNELQVTDDKLHSRPQIKHYLNYLTTRLLRQGS